ncbi:MAG: phage tail tape measure protein [Bacteroidaceae bacterium]|nr:phage tail tape measure protein [Bacteroidaceae bacterium]
MATQYAIDAVFRIIDNASAPMRSISQQGDVAAHAMKKAELRMNAIGNAAKTAVKGAAVGAFAALGVGIASATKQYIEFDQAITSSGALFKDLDSTSESFGASMEALGKTARGVAAITEFNAVDTAGALTKMAYAGMTSETAMELLAGTTDLATAAGTDLTTAVDIATDALGAFNLDATAGNLQRVSDVMAKTASTANTSLTDMFEAIKYAGPGFTAAGQSAETLSAAIGALANAGIKGSSAGTALQAVFTELAKGKKQDILAGYGISIADAEGNFLNLYDIISQIEEKTASMSGVEKSTFLDSVFGVRGGKAMNIILAQGAEAMKAYEATLKSSAGAAAQMAAVMRGSIANQINVLKSGLTELGFKFVEAFKNQGSEALQNLITYVQNFDPAPLIATLTTAFDVLGNIVGAIWNMKEFLIPLIAGIEAYKVAMMGITSFLQIVEVIKGLSGAMAGLNAVMLANPVTLIAAGVAAFVAILAALYPHVENIKVSLEGLWEKLNNNPLGRFLATALLPAHNAIMGIVNTLDAFKNGGFVAGIAAIGKAILANIASPIQAVLNMISNIPGVGKWAKAANDKMNAWFFDAGNQTVVEKINPVIENKNGNAPTVDAPVTQGDRMAYSREESVSDVNLNVAMAPGLTGSVSGKAPGVSFTTTSSGSFGR